MRSLKELFIIVRDNLYIAESICFGICGVALYLVNKAIISDDEYHNILRYMDKNKPIWPSIYAEQSDYNGLYWWPAGEIKPRRKWLNYTIRKLTKEEQKSLNNSAKQILDNSKFGKL